MILATSMALFVAVENEAADKIRLVVNAGQANARATDGETGGNWSGAPLSASDSDQLKVLWLGLCGNHLRFGPPSWRPSLRQIKFPNRYLSFDLTRVSQIKVEASSDPSNLEALASDKERIRATERLSPSQMF